MREIFVEEIRDTVASLLVDANRFLPCDVEESIKCSLDSETESIAKVVLHSLLDNIDAAKELKLPVCQDTGMAVIFLEIGQDVHFTGGLLKESVNEGVKKAYVDGLLRLSVAADPIRRGNTGDNTPAVIHIDLVEGDRVKITAAPKGFGSENMSGVRMLVPADGRQGVMNAVLDIVKKAGSNPCPPMIIGVGIGGDFEQCALLSKKALCRSLSEKNQDPYYAELEDELLQKVNELGIGPQGFGGKTTALGLNIEVAPTHIAGLPVAVNIGCHVTRHKTAIL